MDTKFTKGPWLKCSRGESLIGIEGKNVSVYNCGLSGSGKSPESVANAHLIAAAPDMYELIDALSDFNCPSEYMSESELDAFIGIKRLLAKARGE